MTRFTTWFRGRSLVSAAVVIAAAMGVMNVGTYGFTILAARLLGPVQYGALGALMGLLLVVTVASLGLQATAARRVAAVPEHVAVIEAQILRVSYLTALGLGVLCLIASPVVSGVLGLDSWVAAALLAVTSVPLTVMGGQAGVLQGERRWRPLALVYVAMGVGRLGFGVAALLWRPDALGAMLGVAVGAWLPALVGWLALRRPRHGHQRAATADVESSGGLLHELTHNSHALLAFFALSNADVVVARSVLSEHDAGLYAAGLILTKGVLFLPQFVVVVAFPSMAQSDRSNRTHLKGFTLVLAIGVAATAGILLLSSLAVVFVGGRQYAELESQLWLFAVLGTLLALLQLSVYEVVAQQRQRTVFLIWAALLAVVAAAQLTASVTALVVVVLTIDLVLLVALLALSWRGQRGTPSPPAVVTVG